MRREQWASFMRAAKRQPVKRTPVTLIVDSPWIPGYVGVSHLDYFTDPDVWFEANLKVLREFPDVIFLPSWWVEYGMATEPSALGNRIHFFSNQPPAQSPSLVRLEDVAGILPVNPGTDGLMALVTHLYRKQRARILDAGYVMPVVAARGPLCVASFLRGVTQFMLDVVEDPDGLHRLLDLTTTTIIAWLEAQAAAIGETVEGILVLDDIPGMLSARAYREFAHPYLSRICEAFPADWVKIYHNDANVRPFLADLAGTGFDVLNWTHKIDAGEAWEKTGGRLCLMGNVDPLGLGVYGTPAEIRSAALRLLDQSRGKPIILSVGGGVSPGMPAAHIAALVEAAREFDAR